MCTCRQAQKPKYEALHSLVQNTAARIVSGTQCPWPTQQLLCHLHWLPVHFHINYKLATLTCKVIAFNHSLYISHLLTSYTPACTLRSQDKQLLIVPTFFKVTGR